MSNSNKTNKFIKKIKRFCYDKKKINIFIYGLQNPISNSLIYILEDHSNIYLYYKKQLFYSKKKLLKRLVSSLKWNKKGRTVRVTGEKNVLANDFEISFGVCYFNNVKQTNILMQ